MMALSARAHLGLSRATLPPQVPPRMGRPCWGSYTGIPSTWILPEGGPSSRGGGSRACPATPPPPPPPCWSGGCPGPGTTPRPPGIGGSWNMEHGQCPLDILSKIINMDITNLGVQNGQKTPDHWEQLASVTKAGEGNGMRMAPWN